MAGFAKNAGSFQFSLLPSSHMLNCSFEEAKRNPACEHPQNVGCPDQHGHGQMDTLNGKSLIQVVDGDRIIVFIGEDADKCHND
jgi:hypothetical protein